MKVSALKLGWLALGVAAAPLSTHAATARQSLGCCSPAGADFSTPNGNLGNQRYSSLTAINKANIQTLGPVWRTHVSAASPPSEDLGSQTNPIVVDGVIYMNTPAAGVIAVDGATGAVKWKWQPAYRNAGIRRGVSVGEGKVYALAEGRVVALDAETGAEVWTVQPTAPNGQSLGNIGEVSTVYHDGLVYTGANQGPRGAAFALRASDGALVWSFFGTADTGTVVTDVNGATIDAGATWGPSMADGRSCAVIGGATPWIQPAIDPELGMAYYTFGNVRSCAGSQDGSGRPGLNLFANSVVAVDLKTGAYKWHFQSVHHDIWDMDNTHAPVLADVGIGGLTRKAIYYGSKSGHLFVIDRTNGKLLLRGDERPVPQDSRQNEWPTQPVPSQPFPNCMVYQKLDPANIPGDPWRAVPNYNGYQPNARGELVYTEPNYLDADKPFVKYPAGYGADHRLGCLYDTQWDLPVLSTTSQNGGGDWSSHSFSQRLGLVYFPYGVNPVVHWRRAPTNGMRATGQYQTGGIVAIDASTNRVRWDNRLGLDMAHGQAPLTTASDLLFVGQQDGAFSALDAASGKELWRFQTGSSISSGPITYTIAGQQYVAVFAGGTTTPYGTSTTRGDSLWAFKIGGTYRTDSGSSEAPAPPPLQIRRNVSGGPVEGSTVGNTILLARSSRTADTEADRDRVDSNAMAPTHLRVPVGTTVTFLNPGSETFPNFPNQKLHCATQYFEGAFNAKLRPGERFQYKFDRAGEYYFNDCADPRPTGKVEVYDTPQVVEGAASIAGGALDLRSPTGIFTGVKGTVAVRFSIPVGYTFEGDLKLKTPLSAKLTPAVSARAVGRTVIAQFNKADIDNNVPQGSAVPLTVSGHFRRGGAQRMLTSDLRVAVVK